jgi:hypothetical protein
MKIAFFGGSNVSGGGFASGPADPRIYPNHFAGLGHQIYNGGIDGGNASEIFLNAQRYLIDNDCDLAVIEWNSYTRFRFKAAPNVEISVSNRPIKYPQSTFLPPFSQKDLQKFQKILMMMSHDYHKILDIIDYCIFLSWICEKKNTKLVMLDDIFWSPDMFQDHDDLSSMSDLAKQMLDFDLRSDTELRELLSVMKRSFSRLELSQWLNLFRRLQDHKLDVADDDIHFGPATHAYIAEMIMDRIK